MAEVWKEARGVSQADITALQRSFQEPPGRHTQLLLAMLAAEDIARQHGLFDALRKNRDLAAQNLYVAAFGGPTDAEVWYAEREDPPFDDALHAVGCAVAAETLDAVLEPEMRDLLSAPWAEVMGPNRSA